MKSRTLLLLVLTSTIAGSIVAVGAARRNSDFFLPGHLVVSRSVYDNNPQNIHVGDLLPPNCVPPNCVQAISDGTYPFVFNNDTVDGSFGITSRILLDQITTSGVTINTLEVPNSSQHGTPPTKDQLVTSFSSKSELALNLSTDGSEISFMGYVAPIDALDISNSNAPGVFDSTNPVPGQAFRAVADVDQHGKFRFTETNAYSGNNGRAAVLNNANRMNLFYLAGNAGNGGNPQPDGVIIGAGAQVLSPEVRALVAQNPGLPTPVASFNITQLGKKADKIGKDTNFRGMTIFDNVLYYTKGSGGNGVNTVYFVDTVGGACQGGSGVPQNFASLPSGPLAYDPGLVQTDGLVPTNMCILNGFPTALKSTTSFPFGLWFADANTVYVADEGDGDNTFKAGTYTKAAASPTAGLQKWVFASGTWTLAYTLQNGLNLGTPYAVPGFPNNPINPATGLPWTPATDGLRNITGRVNGDGTVTIWAITSTVSGNGDQGADPNLLVTITDSLAVKKAPAPAGEAFTVLRRAGFGEVLRGLTLTPAASNK